MKLGLFGFRLYSFHLGDYMRRWIFHTPVGTVRLHNIRRPDVDEELHDHPWHFVSFILRGGYVETKPMPGGCPARGPFQEARYEAGSVNFCPADGAHRITEILGDGGCWTLVLSTRRVRRWGFWGKPEGAPHPGQPLAEFIPWRQHVESPEKDWNAEGYEKQLRAVGVVE